MILQIDTAQDWYYQKCDECGGKLRYGFVHGHCHQYGNKPNPENSYCFRIVITDGTGNAVMTCFTPQTDGLIKNVNTLLEEVEDRNPTIIISVTEHAPCFSIQVRQTNRKRSPTFVLQKIMDHPPPSLPGTSERSSSPQVTQAGDHPIAEFTPPPVTPSATQDTPADEANITQHRAESGVRKELFMESTSKETSPDPKKQKKE